MDPVSGTDHADNARAFDVIEVDHAGRGRSEYELICEEPLSIYVGDRLFSVIMRTPGDEEAHAAGFCLSEGLVNAGGELEYIGKIGNDKVSVRLKKDLTGDSFIKRGSIRLPGYGNFDGIDYGGQGRRLTCPDRPGSLTVDAAGSCLDRLPLVQKLRAKTRASHGAVIFDSGPDLLCSAEDVGRHNAIDKAVGKLFLDGDLDRAFLLVLSSRISDELVQKAARAGIPVIVSVSRPTAGAVELGRSLGMTLASFIGERLLIFSGESRIL